MKKSIWLWQFFGFAFTSFCGTLLHFLYSWLDESVFVAPFSAVNESTWEHMKLLFWPMLIFALIQRPFFHERKDFFCIKATGIFLGILLIPILFYTYNGVFGKSPDWINIAIFFISAAVVYIYEAVKLKKAEAYCKNPSFSIFLLVLLAVLFTVFTFATPKFEIFKDPISNSYGI